MDVAAVVFGILTVIVGFIYLVICWIEDKNPFPHTGYCIVGREFSGKILYAVRRKRMFFFKSDYQHLRYGGYTNDLEQAFTSDVEKVLGLKKKLTHKPKEFIVKEKGLLKLVE